MNLSKLWKKFKKNKKRKAKIKKICINFLLLITLILILLIALRFQYFFYTIDNYLTLTLGWIRNLIYLVLISIILIIISNNRSLINSRKIFLCLIIILNFLYFITNIFQLVNNEWSQFWKRESFRVFRMKFNNFINEYQNFTKKILIKLN